MITQISSPTAHKRGAVKAQETSFRNPLAHTRREALEEWQLQKIQAAAEINKHKVKVRRLLACNCFKQCKSRD